MVAAPGGGAYGRTVLHNFRLKVIHVFSFGVAVEMVHSFCHYYRADGLGNGRSSGATGHFNYLALLLIAQLIGGVDKVLSN